MPWDSPIKVPGQTFIEEAASAKFHEVLQHLWFVNP